MNTLLADLRYAVRLLGQSPAFTAIAVLTLALGIGATTALFSVVNGVLLNPLAYPHSDRLMVIYARIAGLDSAPIEYPNFLDWQRDSRSFASMAAYRNEDYNFIGNSEGERLSGYMISANFFDTLGIVPVLGRTFRVDDDQIGAAPVVVLSGGFWKRKFGSSPDIIGMPITLNGTRTPSSVSYPTHSPSTATCGTCTHPSGSGTIRHFAIDASRWVLTLSAG